MATAVLASPAFYEKTRPIFMEYRGEWALVSVSGRLELRLDCKKTNSALQYFVVISPTIGAVSISMCRTYGEVAHYHLDQFLEFASCPRYTVSSRYIVVD